MILKLLGIHSKSDKDNAKATEIPPLNPPHISKGGRPFLKLNF